MWYVVAPNMVELSRRSVLFGAGAAGLAGLLGSSPVAAQAQQLETLKRANEQFAVETIQSTGHSVHWILPGPRRIDPFVFGTPSSGPSSPQRADDHIAHKIWYFEQHRPDVVGLLAGDDDHDPLPLPVGLPEMARETNGAGDRYTRTKIPVPFSDKVVGSDDSPNLDGALDLTYVDRTGFEGQDNVEDEIDLDIWFTDPAGNRYEFDIHHLERHDGAHIHGRGVVTGAYMHGITSIGTPLMPTQYAFGSLWAVGDLLVNGEVTSDRNRDRTIHIMTTQTVRTADYTLAIDEELPLGEDGNPDPYLGNHTHTHVMLPPIKETADGPRRVPLETAFELPNGKPQPFIHFMFDEDTVRIDRSAHPSNRR
jgi:hypothetical protein